MKLFVGIAVLVAATIMVQADFATYLKVKTNSNHCVKLMAWLRNEIRGYNNNYCTQSFH